MPNTRSDGARRTCAAITSVTTTASAETDATSAARFGTVDHRGEDQHGPRNRPPADVAHVRREIRVAGKGVQREQTCRLRQSQNCEAGKEAVPADGDKSCNP